MLSGCLQDTGVLFEKSGMARLISFLCTRRSVKLFGLDAKEKADSGPLKSEVKGLEWASNGHLYIQVDSAILVASADGKTIRPVQEVQEDGTIVAFALSPSGTHLAASIRTPGDNQVRQIPAMACRALPWLLPAQGLLRLLLQPQPFMI